MVTIRASMAISVLESVVRRNVLETVPVILLPLILRTGNEARLVALAPPSWYHSAQVQLLMKMLFLLNLLVIHLDDRLVFASCDAGLSHPRKIVDLAFVKRQVALSLHSCNGKQVIPPQCTDGSCRLLRKQVFHRILPMLRVDPCLVPMGSSRIPRSLIPRSIVYLLHLFVLGDSMILYHQLCMGLESVQRSSDMLFALVLRNPT